MMVRVNGELLDPNLIEETFNRLKSEAEMRSQVSCCERDNEFYQTAEEEVIDSVLIAQEAERKAGDIAEERIRGGMERLVKAYRDHGASWEMIETRRADLREEVIAELRMADFLEPVFAPCGEPSDEELRNYYESRRKEYRTLPEARCLHLMKLTDGREDQRDLLDEMTSLRQRLRAGEDFGTLAEKETEKSTGEVELGWIPLDRPTNPFETVLFSLEVGEISPVLSYEMALHLVTVVERRGGEAPEFRDIRDELLERFLQESRRDALRALAGRLRDQATIERVDFGGENPSGN